MTRVLAGASSADTMENTSCHGIKTKGKQDQTEVRRISINHTKIKAK